jgi:hypothetical protein
MRVRKPLREMASRPWLAVKTGLMLPLPPAPPCARVGRVAHAAVIPRAAPTGTETKVGTKTRTTVPEFWSPRLRFLGFSGFPLGAPLCGKLARV